MEKTVTCTRCKRPFEWHSFAYIPDAGGYLCPACQIPNARTILISENNTDFQEEIDALVKMHRDQGEAIPREEIRSALWNALECMIESLLDELDWHLFDGHSGFAARYEPKQIPSRYASTLEAAGPASMRAHLLGIPQHCYHLPRPWFNDQPDPTPYALLSPDERADQPGEPLFTAIPPTDPAQLEQAEKGGSISQK